MIGEFILEDMISNLISCWAFDFFLIDWGGQNIPSIFTYDIFVTIFKVSLTCRVGFKDTNTENL